MAPLQNNKKNIVLFIKNIVVYAILFAWTLCFLPFGLLFTAIAKKLAWRKGPYMMRLAIYGYAKILWFLLTPFLPIHIQNKNGIKTHSPCIVIANHQSFLDLFLFGAQKFANVCFLTKSWPYKKLFFFAPMMRYAGYIDVETSSPEDLEARCAKLTAEGVSLVVFPEGQRTRDGNLGRFHVGAFQIACRLGLPVVPFVIKNSKDVAPVGQLYLHPQPLRLAVLAPLYVESFAGSTLPHRAMMRAAKECFVNYFTQHC